MTTKTLATVATTKLTLLERNQYNAFVDLLLTLAATPGVPNKLFCEVAALVGTVTENSSLAELYKLKARLIKAIEKYEAKQVAAIAAANVGEQA